MKKKIAIVLCLLMIVVMGMTVNAASALNENYASGATCSLLDGNTISLSAVLPGVPASDDNMLYVYEMAAFEYAVAPTAQPVATIAASQNPSATFSYNGDRLYEKFVFAVKSGGSIVMISHPQYISNPEVLATNTKPRSGHAFKETQQGCFANLYVGTTTYLARDLKRVTQVMNNGGNQAVTNPYARQAMIPTDPRPQSIQAYMLNASEPAGVKTLSETLHKFAANSSSEDWIIGNEVNVRKWNYMIYTDWDAYLREYEQVFRVSYNAIKSANANARVFVCIDQNWDRNRPASHQEYYEYMDGKDFLAKFASDMSASGNIDWGVACHPYTVPLTYAQFWNMAGCPDGAYCANQVSSGKMLTFQNLSLLTNYMQQPEMLSPSGAVRHMMISEVGLSNAQGPDVQGAAMCTAYVAASTNPYIEGIIFLLADSGSVNTIPTGKAMDVFNNMDGANAATYTEWAKSIIGIGDWSQVIK